MMTDTCIVCLGDLRVAIKEEEGLASLSNDDLKTADAAPLPISANNERYPRSNPHPRNDDAAGGH